MPIFAVIVFFLTTTAHAERRVALVIGNSAYKTVSPLANPKNDAKLMQQVLQSAGFDVTLVLNANYHRLKKSIIDFGRKLEKADVGLFYFAGHGVQSTNANFLIPTDAKLEHPDYLEIEAVNINQAMLRMDAAGTKLNIVILDACRNNPFPAFTRASSRGLAVTNAPSGTYIAYATRPGDVAEDGGGKHSPFTAALSRSIKLPGASIEQVFKLVRTDVRRQTKGRQIPWTSSSIEGEFFFHAPLAKLNLNGQRPDRISWELIAKSSDINIFFEFLRQFPDSPLASVARQRILKLKVQLESKDKTVAKVHHKAVIDTANFKEVPAKSWQLAQSMRLLDAPRASGKVIAELAASDLVTVTRKSTDGNWAWAETTLGKNGYIPVWVLAIPRGPDPKTTGTAAKNPKRKFDGRWSGTLNCFTHKQKLRLTISNGSAVLEYFKNSAWVSKKVEFSLEGSFFSKPGNFQASFENQGNNYEIRGEIGDLLILEGSYLASVDSSSKDCTGSMWAY